MSFVATVVGLDYRRRRRRLAVNDDSRELKTIPL